MKQHSFVILDRDGTVIIERDYLTDPDLVELIPGAASGLRSMRELGLGLVVITNQSGIGRGFLDERRLESIHSRLEEILSTEGIELDGIYFCPHLPEDGCPCRKPEPGLVELASRELNFIPSECIVIGDKASDIQLGQRIGATTFLVGTGYGAGVAAASSVSPDYTVDDLSQAALIIRDKLI